MKLSRIFKATDSVVDLINEDYDILPVLSRFSLPLGVENKSIGALCAEAGIDADAFLFVVNFLLSGTADAARLPKVNPVEIVAFLQNSHNYFLEYKYPHIRANLIASLDPAHADINPILVKYFDDYVEQVRNHFRYEEENVFPYIRSVAEGKPLEGYSISTFSSQHDHEVEDNLEEMKNIIVRYYRTSVPYRMYDVLVDIYNCEEDLKQHTRIEEGILVPLVKLAETRIEKSSKSE